MRNPLKKWVKNKSTLDDKSQIPFYPWEIGDIPPEALVSFDREPTVIPPEALVSFNREPTVTTKEIKGFKLDRSSRKLVILEKDLEKPIIHKEETVTVFHPTSKINLENCEIIPFSELTSHTTISQDVHGAVKNYRNELSSDKEFQNDIFKNMKVTINWVPKEDSWMRQFLEKLINL